MSRFLILVVILLVGCVSTLNEKQILELAEENLKDRKTIERQLS